MINNLRKNKFKKEKNLVKNLKKNKFIKEGNLEKNLVKKKKESIIRNKLIYQRRVLKK